jgi:hypothetical protein
MTRPTKLWPVLALLLAVAWRRGHAAVMGHLDFNDLEAKLAECGYAEGSYTYRHQMEHLYGLCLDREGATIRPSDVPPLGITFSDITVKVSSC